MAIANIPRPGDSDAVLIRKILHQLGGTPKPGDSAYIMLRKILDILSVFTSSDDALHHFLEKMAGLHAPCPECPECPECPPFPGIYALQSYVPGGDIVYQSHSTLEELHIDTVCGTQAGEGLTVTQCEFITLLDAPGFIGNASGGTVWVVDNLLLARANFPNAVFGQNNVYFAYNPLLTTLEIPLMTYTNTTVAAFMWNGLTEACVNSILVRAASFLPAVTAATLALEGGTSAAPTGAGAVAKAALLVAGWTVTTN